MQIDDSREQIIGQLQEDWLREAGERMQEHFSAEAESLDQLLNHTLLSINDGDTRAAIKNLVERLEDRLGEGDSSEQSEIEPEWLLKIQDLTSAIEYEVLLEQEEERFQPGDSDSAFIRTCKFFKRFTRGIQRGSAKAVNGIRKIVGGQSREVLQWKQKIPLKNIVHAHLLGLGPWQREWECRLNKLEAEVLLEADAWMLHSQGLITSNEEGDETTSSLDVIPNQKDMVVFFTEAAEQLEDFQHKHTTRLQTILDDIGHQIQVACSLTDTIERSGNDYAASKIAQKEKGIKLCHKKDFKVWRELLAVLLKRTTLSLSFIKLHEQVEERAGGFSASLSEFFENHIEKPIQLLLEELDEVIGIFDDSSEKRTIREVRELSSGHRTSMMEKIEQQILNPIQEFTEDATLSTRLDRFTSAIPEWTKSQPEKATLIETLDLTALIPRYEFEKVDWQVLVQRVLNNHLAKEFMPKEVKPEQFLLKVTQDLQEISQIIYTNLEVADEVKKSDEEEPLEVARDGLERAKTKLEELNGGVRDKRTDLEDKLFEKRKAAFEKLANLLKNQDVNEVRMTGAEYKAKETAVDWKTKGQVWWAVITEKVELFSRFIWKKIKHYVGIVRKFLGFAEKEKLEGDKTDLATFLSETDEQIAGLPFIYRRLFDFHKEVDERFFIRKPEQFDRFKKGYELWKDEFPSTLAIVGEKGSGKSLFVDLLMKEVLLKHEVIEINFEDTIWSADEVATKVASSLKIDDIEDIEDLIAAIKRKKKRVVVILENIQNCYIRNINGFEAIEQLLLLVSETNKEILWVSSSTRYAWMFLDRVLNIADYFTHAVETDNLNAIQIEELILRRHRASGYQLKFMPDEATKKSRNFKKLMDSEEKTQEYLQEKYFEKLAKLSEGNSSVAMIFWIRSIREYDETHFYINPFDFTAISRIGELENTELFALAAFVLHDSLTAEHLSKILNQPLREAKLMVSRLTSRSILFKTDHGYMLNHLIYRQLVRVLKEANYIH